MSKQPPPAPTASAVGPCPTVIQIVRRTGTGSLPSTFAPPDHPQEREKEERKNRGELKYPNYPTYCKRSRALPYYYPNCRTPRHWKFTQDHRTPPPKSILIGWLVGCFGFNGPLRQYFSLYRAVSQGEGEREQKGKMRVKMSKQPPPAPTASAVGPCPTVIQIVGRPGTGSLPSTFAPPDHPQSILICLAKL